MKKMLYFFMLLLAMTFILTGCFNNNSTTFEYGIITGANPNDVFYDYETLKLSYKVENEDEDLEVKWSTNKPHIASIKDGIVKFHNVYSTESITIYAKNAINNSIYASLPIFVKHSNIDYYNSYGIKDIEEYMDDGKIKIDSDFAFVSNNIYSNKWYIQGTFSILNQSKLDPFSKIGIMTGINPGSSTNDLKSLEAQNVFYYFDLANSQAETGWSYLGLTCKDDTLSKWDFTNQNAWFSLDDSNKIFLNQTFKIGLLRDGIHYYLFYGNGDSREMNCYLHTTNDAIKEDENTYAWFGGWSSSVELSDIITLQDDEVDGLFDEPSYINAGEDVTLLSGSNYLINPTTDIYNVDYDNFEYEVDDNSVATINQNGLLKIKEDITKKAKLNVFVNYITETGAVLRDSICITVMPNTNEVVELDGLMSDAMWNNKNVLDSSMVIENSNKSVKIKLYASRNSSGIYFFAEYKTKELHLSNDWWIADNLEFRILSLNGKINNPLGTDRKFYASTLNGDGTTNFTGGYIGKPVQQSDGYYLITYELFQSFESLKLSSDDPFGFTLASNVGGAEFFTTDVWSPNNLIDSYKITSDGISTYIEESQCKEHVYDNGNVIKEAGCKSGLILYTCKLCQNSFEDEIISNGEHVYSTDNMEILEHSTCLEMGSAKLFCVSGCGNFITSTLPLDYNNHTQSMDIKTGEMKCCGSLIEDAIIADVSGWNSNVFKINMEMTEDFEIEFIFNSKRTSNSTDNSHTFVGEVYSLNWSNDGWTYVGSGYGWAGWSGTYESLNKGIWINSYKEASTDVDVVLNVKYDSTSKTFITTIKYHSNIDAYSQEDLVVTFRSKEISYFGEVVVTLGANNSKTTIYSAKILYGVAG